MKISFLIGRALNIRALVIFGLLVGMTGTVFAAKAAPKPAPKTVAAPVKAPTPPPKAPTPPPAKPAAPTAPPKAPAAPVAPAKTTTPATPVAPAKPTTSTSTPTTGAGAKAPTPASTATKPATPTPATTGTGSKTPPAPSTSGAKTATPTAGAKPADTRAADAKTPAAGTDAAKKPGLGDKSKTAATGTPDAPAAAGAEPAAAKPSMFSKLSGAVAGAGGIGGIASMAGGLASNPLVQMAAQKVGGDQAAAALGTVGSAANVASAAASGDVMGAVAGAGNLTGIMKSPPPAAAAPVAAVVADPVAEPQDPAPAPAAAEDVAVAVDGAAPVAAAAHVAVPVAATVVAGGAVAAKPPVAVGVATPVVKTLVVGAGTPDQGAVTAYVHALVESLKTADFNASSVAVAFAAAGGRYTVTIPLHPGLSNQDQPFNSVTATLESTAPESVKAALMPLLTLNPEEVFVIKVILMLNSAHKQSAADFDVNDFILVNLPMLLYRLERTKDGVYEKSSRGAIEAVRTSYRPILALVQFPENHWYDRVVTDMPGGEATPFMKAVSALRWQAGHEDRSQSFSTKLLPLLSKDRNPLERAYFEYAILEQLQEYDGGFVKSDSADFIKRVIDSRLTVLEPVLRDAVVKMKAAECNADAIAKVEAFVGSIASKPRVADSDADPLVRLIMPAVPVEGLGSGVDYFLKVVDPFMRANIIHRPIHGDRGYVYFDFGYDSDQAREALVSLAIRSLRGMGSKDLQDELADIYFRADDAVVDGFLGHLATTQGYKVSEIQSASAKAKKAAVEVVEEEHDDGVMEPKNI